MSTTGLPVISFQRWRWSPRSLNISHLALCRESWTRLLWTRGFTRWVPPRLRHHVREACSSQNQPKQLQILRHHVSTWKSAGDEKAGGSRDATHHLHRVSPRCLGSFFSVKHVFALVASSNVHYIYRGKLKWQVMGWIMNIVSSGELSQLIYPGSHFWNLSVPPLSRDSVDPGILNSFATAAYRFGHSLVQSIFRLIHVNSRKISARSSRDVGTLQHTLLAPPKGTLYSHGAPQQLLQITMQCM